MNFQKNILKSHKFLRIPWESHEKNPHGLSPWDQNSSNPDDFPTIQAPHGHILLIFRVKRQATATGRCKVRTSADFRHGILGLVWKPTTAILTTVYSLGSAKKTICKSDSGYTNWLEVAKNGENPSRMFKWKLSRGIDKNCLDPAIKQRAVAGPRYNPCCIHHWCMNWRFNLGSYHDHRW